MILTPLVRSFAHRYGLYDKPDSRKVHTKVIPRLGGIAIAIAFSVPVLGLLVYLNRIGEQLAGQQGFLLALAGGGIPILALGIWDDIRGCGHKLKFFVQIAVAVFAVLCGVVIDVVTIPGFGVARLGLMSPVITVFWIVGIINAINLVDGLDGLASGVCFFAVLTLFFSGIVDGDVTVCVVSMSLCGAIVGFLFFNFNPATIFMGDSGSMFLGYVLATLSIATTSKGATLVALTVPMLALGLPIFDTIFAIFRRIYLRRPVFSADKGHIHHRLLALGLNQRQAVLFLYTVCMVFAATGVILRVTRDAMAGAALLFAGLLVFAVIHVFRFRDVMSRRASVHTVAFEKKIRDHALVDLREIGRAVRNSDTMTQTWAHLKRAADILGVSQMRVKLHIRSNEVENLDHDLSYIATPPELDGEPISLTIPLMDKNFLYGEMYFDFTSVESIDPHRRAMMYLLAEHLLEFFQTAFADRSDELFVVQRHPARIDVMDTSGDP